MEIRLGWILVGAALPLLALAITLYRRSFNARFRERIASNFFRMLPQTVAEPLLGGGAPSTYWTRLRARSSIFVGFELQDWHLVVIPLVLVAIALLGSAWRGLPGAFLCGGTAAMIAFVVPYTRLRRRQRLAVTQVPLFVDQVLRSLGTGRSLEGAVRLAIEEAAPPLGHILMRVLRATDLGADLPTALRDTAKLHGLKELDLIALAVRISNNFGSSPKEMLQSVVQMIRQQEQAQRELAAMTGETRISAWFLGLIPIAIAFYMMLVNPSYLDLMLQESSGRIAFATALGLQGAGVLVLWRMMKSV